MNNSKTENEVNQIKKKIDELHQQELSHEEKMRDKEEKGWNLKF